MQAYPFISDKEFTSSCEELVEAFEASRDGEDDWLIAEIKLHHDQRYLRILKHSRSNCLAEEEQRHDDGEYASSDVEEIDEQTHPGTFHKTHSSLLEYHIIHSPVYRVPVVWILISPQAYSRHAKLGYMFENIVPREFRQSIENTGFYGGISLADHPILGGPAYFVHPCNTAEALKPIQASGIKPSQYLILWLGLVGGSVQLFVPPSLALEIAK